MNFYIPQIRIKEYQDSWKKQILSDLLIERNELVLEDNNYPLMSFVQNKGITEKDKYDRSFLIKNTNKKYKKTKLNDFIYSSNNLHVGSIGINNFGNAVISPVYSIFKSKNKYETRFINLLAQTPEFIYKILKFRQGVVYGQLKINEDDFLTISIYVPEYFEQKQLIIFFQDIDDILKKISLKIKKLSLLKKGLLQKLFVNNNFKYPEIRFKEFSDAWEKVS